MNDIQQLEEQLRKIKYRKFEMEYKDKLALEKDFKKENKIDVYCSSDYAGLDTEHYNFYYGYERTYCPKHKIYDCIDDSCESKEWCFVATIDDEEVLRVPESKLWFEEKGVLEMLLLGIGKFLENYSLGSKKEN